MADYFNEIFSRSVILTPFVSVFNFLFGGMTNILLVFFIMLGINVVLETIIEIIKMLNSKEKFNNLIFLKIVGTKLLAIVFVIVANLIDMSEVLTNIPVKTVVVVYVLVTEFILAINSLDKLGYKTPLWLSSLLISKKNDIDSEMEQSNNLDTEETEVDLDYLKDIEENLNQNNNDLDSE